MTTDAADAAPIRDRAVGVAADAGGRIGAGLALYLTGDWQAAHLVAVDVAPDQPAAVLLLDLAYLVAGHGIAVAAGGDPDRLAAAHRALLDLVADLAAHRGDPVALTRLLTPTADPRRN